MREIKQVIWYYVDMRWLSDITTEVYGRAYDIQMGEKSNGSYEVWSTSPTDWRNDYPAYVEDESAEYGIRNIETVAEAIAIWTALPEPKDPWARPDWQPEVWAVLSDLADKGEIPHGEYFVSIDW